VATPLKRPDAIREILVQACARNELLILVTPYLRFESNFVGLEGGELHAAATMSRDDATFGLRAQDLRIRFPVGLGFMEAPTRLVGLGLHGGRRTVRLAVPKVVYENDDRADYRVERVGRVEVTCGTIRGDLLQTALVDLSTRGARLHTRTDVAATGLQPGSTLFLSIPVDDELQLEARAEVRHAGPRTLGLEFAPPLPQDLQESLSRWVFKRREEDEERLAQRVELGLRQPVPSAPSSGRSAGAILMVGGSPELETALAATFKEFLPLVRIPLAAQELKDALRDGPLLALFVLDGPGLDARRRVKALVELAVSRVPVLLLGLGVDSDELFKLGAAWKVASTLAWTSGRSGFLLRLARGVLRQRAQGDGILSTPTEF
jgi:hypothetical protein